MVLFWPLATTVILLKKVASEIWHLDQGGLEIFNGSYDEYEKYRGGNDNNQENLDEIVIKMKRAELLSKLEDAGPQEKEELIIKLNNLNK